MANIDKVSVKNTVYNIVSPAVVSDYIEVIGGACTKPDGYDEDEVILAKQNDVQLLFKATQDIAFGANIVENTNCVRTTLEEVLKNAGGGGGASSADQVSYDNSDSGLEAENVQEAVDELATNAGTASSQIQTLTNETYNVNDTAITEVASNDLLPIYDTSATGKKKIAVSSFIGGLVSNPNLIENPWFTVNQRGATSMSTAGYFCDRWKVNTGNVGQSCSLTNDGLVVTASSGGNDNVLQVISEELGANLVGKTVTLSVKFKAATNVKIGVRKSSAWSFILQKSIQSASDEIVSVTGVVSSDTSHNFKITISASDESSAYSATIEAVKLELGSVSTLAQDTAPNYATELLKCQRYYQRINTRANVTFGLALAVSATIAIMPITINTMRALPSVGEDVTGMSLKTADDATSNAITAINGFLEGDVAHGVLTFTSTSLVVGTIYKVEFANSTSYIDFSADL